jgi:hypothetical protein
MSERVEKHPGAIPAGFPPPIITKTTSIFVFRVSLPPLLGNAEGVFYRCF